MNFQAIDVGFFLANRSAVFHPNHRTTEFRQTTVRAIVHSGSPLPPITAGVCVASGGRGEGTGSAAGQSKRQYQ